jgi:Protein N-terminal asparagine amidohydrolase
LIVVTCHLLADIAAEENNIAVMIQTMEIGSMNSQPYVQALHEPIGWGLAMECTTRKVFLTKFTTDVMGPVFSLRRARLWSPCNNTLLVIGHEKYADTIIISPFKYEMNLINHCHLLQLSDEKLLQVASTSTYCEDYDFCSTLRSTLQFMMNQPYNQVFPASSNDSKVSKVISLEEENDPKQRHFKCLRSSQHNVKENNDKNKAIPPSPNLTALVFHRSNSHNPSCPNHWILHYNKG